MEKRNILSALPPAYFCPAGGILPPLSSGMLPAERIPPFIPGYRLEEFIGKGGSSEVWRGKDLQGEPCACRILFRDPRKGAALREQDWESHQLYLERVEPYRNLIRILRYGEKKEFRFLVTELADNLFPGGKYQADTLRNRLRHPAFFPVTFRETARWMGALLLAIAFLHKKGIAHNDIKPENILFIRKTPILADPGLAAPLQKCVTGGTLDYRPAREDPTGEERDIYAIGKILYELFTGKSPGEYPLLPETFRFGEKEAAFCNRIVKLCCHNSPRERVKKIEDLLAFFPEEPFADP